MRGMHGLDLGTALQIEILVFLDVRGELQRNDEKVRTRSSSRRKFCYEWDIAIGGTANITFTLAED